MTTKGLIYVDQDCYDRLSNSIEHWRGMRDLKFGSGNPNACDCDLCIRFASEGETCRGCPIRRFTHRIRCRGTPYHRARVAFGFARVKQRLDASCEWLIAAQAEIDFLERVLAKCRVKKTKPQKVNHAPRN